MAGPVRPKPGAPNVVYIVIDDVGFGQLSCYGGLCDTPNMHKLAQNGMSSSYEPPFEFKGGGIHHVTVDVSGELIPDPESEMRVALVRQ